MISVVVLLCQLYAIECDHFMFFEASWHIIRVKETLQIPGGKIYIIFNSLKRTRLDIFWWLLMRRAALGGGWLH